MVAIFLFNFFFVVMKTDEKEEGKRGRGKKVIMELANMQ
jgi:hypothetical protein